MLAAVRRNKKRTMEVLVGLAVLAIIASALVPYYRGQREVQRENGWKADKASLQDAVYRWLTDTSDGPVGFPTLGGSSGTPLDANGDGDFDDSGDVNSFIDIGALADRGLLDGRDAIRSASTALNTTAHNPGGSYGWYLDAAGEVQGWYDANRNNRVDSGEVGYRPGLYP
jgi:type II secretory pathway pseudopilin PulG